MTSSGSLLAPLFQKMEWAAKLLRLPSEVIEKELKHFKDREGNPDRIRVPLDYDRGKDTYDVVSLFFSLHYNPHPDDKPHKGGIRMSHELRLVNADVMRALSVDMTLKEAVMGLPFGGAKAGILIPRPASEYSSRERNRIFEGITEAFFVKKLFDLRTYCGATDYGTTETDMDRINYKYWSLDRESLPLGTVVTGRSVDHGGIPGRREATARGCLIVLGEIIRKLHPELAERTLTVNVQGLGQVGGNIVRLARVLRDEIGLDLLITGISNATGGVWNPSGIDISLLPENPNAHLDHIPGERGAPNEILMKPCDIVLPAATENTITEDIANRMQAQICCEGANSPTTPSADRILKERGILVIPDILANAGGVTVSFEEWRRSFHGPYHEIEYEELLAIVNTKLDAEMTAAAMSVLEYADHYRYELQNVKFSDLRGAAIAKGMDRIAREIRRKHAAWTS